MTRLVKITTTSLILFIALLMCTSCKGNSEKDKALLAGEQYSSLESVTDDTELVTSWDGKITYSILKSAKVDTNTCSNIDIEASEQSMRMLLAVGGVKNGHTEFTGPAIFDTGGTEIVSYYHKIMDLNSNVALYDVIYSDNKLSTKSIKIVGTARGLDVSKVYIPAYEDTKLNNLMPLKNEGNLSVGNFYTLGKMQVSPLKSQGTLLESVTNPPEVYDIYQWRVIAHSETGETLELAEFTLYDRATKSDYTGAYVLAKIGDYSYSDTAFTNSFDYDYDLLGSINSNRQKTIDVKISVLSSGTGRAEREKLNYVKENCDLVYHNKNKKVVFKLQ